MLHEKSSYITSIRAMLLRLLNIQDNDIKTQELKTKDLLEGWEDTKSIIHHQGLPYVSKIIQSKLLSYYYNNLLADHFGIEEIW